MQPEKFDTIAHLRGLVGALVGGAVGYFLFAWMLKQGYYALALPGALVGLACGYASGIRSVPLAAICGVLTLPLLLFLEWQFRAFVVDDSLGYFLTHLHRLTPVTLVMMALGVVFAVWFGLGRNRLR